MLILSDNQDITRAGLQWLCSEMKHNDIAIATDKTTLARLLEGQEHATVVLDYTLFDFTSFDELLIALRGEPYHYAPLVQMANEQWQEVERVKLTKTEMEVLRDIALGLTTKEIAEKRFSSFHTINTHRKNIFRKLNVNNIHEATKYALRAGMVDAAEYYI